MAWVPQKMNYSHDALVEQIIANPTATNRQLGEVFGRTEQWVCMVKNSDMFRERLYARRAEVTDPILTANVESRLEMVTARSLEVLMEKMAKPSEDIPDNLALAAAALGAKGMGVGGFSNRPAPPPEAPPAGRLERLSHRLLSLNPGARPATQETIDATFRELPLPVAVRAG